LKLNNRKVYPDANHQPRHLANLRRQEAKERQEAYNVLSILQKLNLLDARLGLGLGAKKQRARLTVLLEKQKAVSVPQVPLVSVSTDKSSSSKKK
jgi:hypothetical protein